MNVAGQANHFSVSRHQSPSVAASPHQPPPVPSPAVGSSTAAEIITLARN